MQRLTLGILPSLVLAAQAQTLIHVDSRLVQVDVTVRNRKGPVRGLTQDDFTVFDKGKPQPLALFQVTEAGPQRGEGVALPPGMVSNRIHPGTEGPGSVTVILVDRLNTPRIVQPYADREVLRFLQSARTGDPIAIYVLGEQIRVVQDFTTDLERLKAAAARISLERSTDLSSFELIRELAAAGADTAPLQEMANLVKVDRATGTMRALSLIAQHLAAISGRKNLVWVSSSFPLVIRLAGIRRDFVPEIRAATRKLNEANVVVYPVDARGLMTGGGPVAVVNLPSAPGAPANNFSMAPPGSNPEEGIDTMNTIASWTGGQAYYNTNDLKGAIRQAIRDAEVTYTLGFYAPQALDGSFHDLHVKVARGGVDVRYRKGYLASLETPPTEKQRLDALKEIFANPLEATAVGLQANARKDGARPGLYHLTLHIEPRDLHLQQNEDGWSAAVSVALSLDQAKSPRFTVGSFPVHLSPDQLKTALQDGIVEELPVETDGTATQVRVVVQDQSTGEAGSVRVPLGTH